MGSICYTSYFFIRTIFIRIKAQIPKKLYKKLRIHYIMYWGWTDFGYSYKKLTSVIKLEKKLTNLLIKVKWHVRVLCESWSVVDKWADADYRNGDLGSPIVYRCDHYFTWLYLADTGNYFGVFCCLFLAAPGRGQGVLSSSQKRPSLYPTLTERIVTKREENKQNYV